MCIRFVSALRALAPTVFLLTIGSAQAMADNDDPMQRIVTYSVYADPANPTQLDWTISLHVTEVSSTSTSVTWEVTAVEILEGGAAPGSDGHWSDSAPTVSSGTNGLWVVSHANPADPQDAEFAMPPAVDGIGLASGSDPDLTYQFSGTAYTPPPGGAHFAATAALDLIFWLDGSTPPIEEREEEPVRIVLNEPLIG